MNTRIYVSSPVTALLALLAGERNDRLPACRAGLQAARAVLAPDWSPVSDHIVFTSCTCELSIVGVDGTGLARLAESPVSLLSSRKPRSSRGASTANSLATAIR